jgi:CRP-like cAMP-binding protein
VIGEFDFLSVAGRDNAFVPLSAGDILFAKGDSGTTMFIVRSGRLEIFDGKLVHEAVGPGGILGEMGVVDDEPRSASARAVTAAEVIIVDRPNFEALVDQTPAFAIQVMRVMSRRLRATNKRLHDTP